MGLGSSEQVWGSSRCSQGTLLQVQGMFMPDVPWGVCGVPGGSAPLRGALQHQSSQGRFHVVGEAALEVLVVLLKKKKGGVCLSAEAVTVKSSIICITCMEEAFLEGARYVTSWHISPYSKRMLQSRLAALRICLAYSSHSSKGSVSPHFLTLGSISIQAAMLPVMDRPKLRSPVRRLVALFRAHIRGFGCSPP